ncbi:bifunctional DNA-formamidopyrimidine glycosylase/DNA-(apurinic or apyrimidinic site) lyase [Patescibacteria group bacterium]
MPELPEVETIRQDLAGKLIGKPIKSIVVRKDKIVRGGTVKFKRELQGQSFQKIGRRGKLLIFDIARTDTYLLVHLKMTGQLIYQRKGKRVAGGHPLPALDMELPNKHTHIIIIFVDGSKLFFNDLRQFGFMQLVSARQCDGVIAKFGIEPLTKDFTLEKFRQIFKNRKISLKAVLLNQKLVAGIGNIYADEISFAAGVRPSRRVDRLTRAEIERLYKYSKRVIARAVKYRGTTFSNFVDASGQTGNFVSQLAVYGREDKKCKKCKSYNIKKIKLAGRGTHYCSRCQK